MGSEVGTGTKVSFKLNSGHQIPGVGLGTWRSEPGQVGEAVKTAIKAGYRHIDCAAIYGNEAEIGVALQSAFKEGLVKREELFVTSKLWNDQHAAEDVPQALKQTLSDLKLEYLDLYLIHWPLRVRKGDTSDSKLVDETNYEETWRAMERVKEQGLVKSIGVSNLSMKKLGEVLSYAKVPPAVNQIELHPLWRNDKMLAFAKEKGVHLSAYSPLGSGDENRKVLEYPVVKQIAEKLGKSPAQVVLRWGLQRGTSVLPKSTNFDRLRSNLEVTEWSLSEEDMKALSSIEDQGRIVAGTGFVGKKTGPYKTTTELWDGEL
ncbi:alcohol dehydrogenase (NADP+) [Klebsormidium nitens]|uniref:Alcohol dehydrogenase (NADP+) n=1 Tax=Klebsormidium nitens TaxID=105231 RepID=A0A1Y1HTF9_KLENI|nr:alcohol dehydrogenase (NADP+) [Klebsormidium nitens]|eukprot:GAQ80469.1 alcohol dehydrogenase (NADP+) [Klebsormidium nitens]